MPYPPYPIPAEDPLGTELIVAPLRVHFSPKHIRPIPKPTPPMTTKIRKNQRSEVITSTPIKVEQKEKFDKNISKVLKNINKDLDAKPKKKKTTQTTTKKITKGKKSTKEDTKSDENNAFQISEKANCGAECLCCCINASKTPAKSIKKSPIHTEITGDLLLNLKCEIKPSTPDARNAEERKSGNTLKKRKPRVKTEVTFLEVLKDARRLVEQRLKHLSLNTIPMSNHDSPKRSVSTLPKSAKIEITQADLRIKGKTAITHPYCHYSCPIHQKSKSAILDIKGNSIIKTDDNKLVMRIASTQTEAKSSDFSDFEAEKDGKAETKSLQSPAKIKKEKKCRKPGKDAKTKTEIGSGPVHRGSKLSAQSLKNAPNFKPNHEYGEISGKMDSSVKWSNQAETQRFKLVHFEDGEDSRIEQEEAKTTESVMNCGTSSAMLVMHYPNSAYSSNSAEICSKCGGFREN